MVRWIRLALIQCKKNVITQNRIRTRFKKFCHMPFQNALFCLFKKRNNGKYVGIITLFSRYYAFCKEIKYSTCIHYAVEIIEDMFYKIICCFYKLSCICCVGPHLTLIYL